MDELRLNAMLAELEAQRGLLGTRCAHLAGELATELNRTKVLTEQNEKQAQELEALKAKPAKAPGPLAVA